MKICCDNWQNTSLKNDVLYRWPLRNFGSWTYFFIKLCQLNLIIVIQNLWVCFCHLSQVWILETKLKIRPKFYFDTIALPLNFKFGQKVHLIIFLNNFHFWPFLLIPVCKIHISGCSIPTIPYFKKQKCFWLEFWPLIGLNEFTSSAKFDHLPAWYITDGFVNCLPIWCYFGRTTSTITG